MKREGTENVTGLKFENRIGTQSRTRSPIKRSLKITGIHFYTWVEKATVREKCLAQEKNTMSPARSRTWTSRKSDALIIKLLWASTRNEQAHIAFV